jgi:signal transduction histidine kinase
MRRVGIADDLGITSVAEGIPDQAGVSAARGTERAHALKNCAAVILAIARLTAPDLPTPHRERLERLREAATRLVRLLNDELREAASEDLETARLLKAACDLVHDRAEARGVMLIASCAGGRVRGEARALEEVLVNLIGNAIDASSAGQIVRVAARVVSGRSHQWIIEDAGSGMPAHVLAGVGGVVRSARPLGSGFGIALATRTIQAHGGTLRFESRDQRGTRVVVDLPFPT